MIEKKELIDEIVGKEWKMMDKVNNAGGRASCQDDRFMFYRMRKNQFYAWDEKVLKSYKNDLCDAEEKGDNLLQLKYAYMMAVTDPNYYREYLAPSMPVIKGEIEELIKLICELLDGEYHKLAEKYPYFISHGRPAGNGETVTSVSTYLKGELYTYSNKTLALFLGMLKKYDISDKNYIYEVYTNTAKGYGFRTLEEAEERLKGLS